MRYLLAVAIAEVTYQEGEIARDTNLGYVVANLVNVGLAFVQNKRFDHESCGCACMGVCVSKSLSPPYHSSLVSR